MRLNRILPTLLAAAAIAASSPALAGPRIKDIVSVENVRSNQLVGYGLVVGLAGTGDRLRNVPFTEESMQAMLERMGVNVRGSQMRSQNVAAVSITATLPPFARSGSTIDVQVSALGDATSLQGGTLIASALRGMDGQIYAVAQGPVAVSGFRAQGAAASVSRGVSTSARIAGGGIVEREVPYSLSSAGTLKLALRNPDFTTAQRIAATINREYPGSAQVLDPATVEVAPAGSASLIDMVTRVENLEVDVDQPARIVINEAAGTVVMTSDVRVSPVAVAQGGLTISVAETPQVSQPAPFSQGETTMVPRTQVDVDDGQGRSLAMVGGTSLQQLVGGLNALGVSPRDLITILQAVKSAGALQAEIEVQ
ncbi:flagellar basal body P-ring protein FlgI [Sphingosinicella terrae]|uniref:flagellar basal body P-ring protein FlgI n=1 Tax=Sphingosinicella terrae TaxID=2172047 RepID=UPI000E0D6B0C|nr:flagellar basal body P-ring protein FlgI [Sphingosinicella terrae]